MEYKIFCKKFIVLNKIYTKQINITILNAQKKLYFVIFIAILEKVITKEF